MLRALQLDHGVGGSGLQATVTEASTKKEHGKGETSEEKAARKEKNKTWKAARRAARRQAVEAAANEQQR